MEAQLVLGQRAHTLYSTRSPFSPRPRARSASPSRAAASLQSTPSPSRGGCQCGGGGRCLPLPPNAARPKAQVEPQPVLPPDEVTSSVVVSLTATRRGGARRRGRRGRDPMAPYVPRGVYLSLPLFALSLPFSLCLSVSVSLSLQTRLRLNGYVVSDLGYGGRVQKTTA